MVKQQRLQMRVTIIFAGLMMFVIRASWGQFFQPLANVFDKTVLQVVDIYGGGDVHRRNKAQAVFHPAAGHNLFDFWGNMHHLASLLCFEHHIFGVTLHRSLPVTCLLFGADSFILKAAVEQTHVPNAEALSQRGLDLLAEGSPAQALRAFREAIDADPTYYEAHHGLIRALRDAGQLEQSVAAALALSALTPSDPLAHAALSICLQVAGHVPEAEAAAARARILEWKIQLQSPPQEDPLR
jgi:tetratricopeptide (TPR) repeat protein